jgi:UDP-2-acetamido-2-deoxy-ribo-hexuluronate aminotransferase
MDFIDLKTQYRQLKPEIDRRIQAVLDHGAYVMGPEVAELEAALAAFTGSRHCITVSSGTDALLIAMMALGIAPGDEVITTPFSFIATAESIALLGARPVFVDIEPRTYNLDPARLESVLSPRTRAIMPVSLYGQCADFAAINRIAAAHDLPVIEDAAQSFGARYRGRRSCALSDIGCTSFFPSKPLGCYGDGGACFTDDDALANRMREIRVHGQDRRYHHPVLGLNGRMDTLQCAVLLAKLPAFEDELVAREAAGERYSDLLRAASGRVVTPLITDGSRSVYAQYTVELDDREHARQALESAGIPTAVHYPIPLHLQPAFAALGYGPGSFPVAERAAARVLSLPLHPFLDPMTQQRVVTTLMESLGG